MCEARLVRFVHVMEHPDYDDELHVGCVCAGHMEGDLLRARKREESFKTIQIRRKRWLNRKWRVSKLGNLLLNTHDGFMVVIYDRGAIWGARVQHRRSGYKRISQLPYLTRDQAKLAAFDVMIDMKRRAPWQADSGA